MPPPADGSMPSSFDELNDYNENVVTKVINRLKKEPLIPIGLGLTVYALVQAAKSMKAGDHARTNRMFRARVYAQGFTVLSIAGYGLYYGNERKQQKELQKIQAEKEAEERKQRWIRELEIRDAEDRAIREKMEKRRQRREARAANQDAKKAGEKTVEKAGEPETQQSGGGWGLGGWFGGSKKADPPSPEPPKEPEKPTGAASE